MLPDRVSNPGPLTYESGAPSIALRGLSLPGEATLLFSFLLPFSMGSTLKGKNLLHKEQILSFMSRPQLWKVFFIMGQKSCFPL